MQLIVPTLLTLSVTIAICEGATVGELKIRFKSFTNPGGQGDNGHCCDGKWGFCQGHGCDHYFIICLDSAGSSNSTAGCQYTKRTSSKIRNQNNNIFTDKIGNVDNPLEIKFDSHVPASVALKVDVWDSDGIGRDDHVDFLRINLNLDMDGEPQDLTVSSRTSLLINIVASCSMDRYGRLCDKFCKPEGNIQRCDSEGNPVCAEGWQGGMCTEKSTECGSDWKEFGGNCYLFTTARATWVAARSYCKRQGADLLKMETQAESGFITRILASTVNEAGRGAQLVWIGANDRSQEGDWVWADGSKASFTNWRRGEPNDHDQEDCGSMYQSQSFMYSGKWNDINCITSTLQFICEKPSGAEGEGSGEGSGEGEP